MADRGTVRRRGRGFGARGGFSNRQQQQRDETLEQESEAPEVKSLREKHGGSVASVQAVFPDWDEVSVLYALSEAHGSVELAISRIVEGQAEQWGSVKPKKQQKKEATSAEATHDGQSTSTAVSGRGSFGGRGRGRGDFRGGRGGRGGARGGRGGAVSGRPQPANGEVTVTEVTEAAVNADGTVTSTTVTEAEGQGVAEVSVKETSTDAEGTSVQVEETVSVVEKPQRATKPTNGWAQKGKGTASAAPAQSSAPAAAAKKVAQPGAKLSWAQIARPPSPKPQPAPVPKAAPAQAESAPQAEAAEAPVETVVVAEVVAEEPEPVIVIAEVEVPAQEAAQAAPQDPWSSTPAAAVLSSEEQQPAEPTALAVGEGWADSIIAKSDYDQAHQISPEEQASQEAQHQRAQEAAPPAGVNPAGALDVHTPGPNELPSSQLAAPQSMAPPGLTKRASALRGKQDAPVVMPGSTPDIERMGVQFGSLNLFGSIPAASELPAQEEAPQQSQQSLYESAPVQQQQEAQQPAQSVQNIAQQAQQAPAAYDIQQQAQAQYYQSQAQKQQQPSQYGGVFDRFGAQQQPQQQHYQAPQQQQAPASAYSSRYQPFGQPAQQAQQPQDPFASVTSPYMQNIARTGSAQQQHQANVPSLGGVDSISPYYSSQQAQNLQSHHATQAQQTTASPAPQSVRESAGSVPPQQAASAYGGFTSAIGQATQAHQPQQQNQQGYPTDYSSFYGMQDQGRNLQGYYGQTEQVAQQPYRPSATDDLTAKLGASSATAASGLGAQPQQQQQLGQQQQQHYNPNMMGGYNYPYYPYGGGYGNPSYGGPGGYPAYPSQQYGYGGYNQQSQNRSAYQGATGANHSHQNSTGAPNNNAYSRSYGNNASAGLGGSGGASAYGSNAYGSFDSGRNAQSGVQGLGQGQQDRSASAGDAFNDPRYSTNY